MKSIGTLLILLLVSFSWALQGDYCDDPFVIPEVPYGAVMGQTSGFSNDFSMDLSCTGQATDGPDVIYEYSTGSGGAGAYGAFVIPLTPSFNAAIYVLTDCYGEVCLAGNDIFGQGSNEEVQFSMPANTTFWIVIDGRGPTDMGMYAFSVNGPPCSAEEGSEDIPTQTSVRVNPNPFKGITEIGFSLAQSGHVSATIYSKSGALVRRLVEGEKASGSHTLTWDSRDEEGSRVTEGVYFLVLRTADTEIVKKIAFVR
jgi:hypothetical protein